MENRTATVLHWGVSVALVATFLQPVHVKCPQGMSMVIAGMWVSIRKSHESWQTGLAEGAVAMALALLLCGLFVFGESHSLGCAVF